MTDEIPKLIKDLAEGVSAAVEVQNRYWLALAITSLFVLIQQPAASSSAPLALPLGLPPVDASWFSLLAVLILSTLITGFAAAQARMVRTTKLTHRILADRYEAGCRIAAHDERDLFDALRKPSIGQVASLAQIIRGRHQFFVDQPASARWRVMLSSVMYVFFKVPALIVWLMLPALALYFAVVRFQAVGAPDFLHSFWPWLVLLFAATASVSLFIALWLEIEYMVDVAIRVWAGVRPPNKRTEQTP